MKGNNKGFTIVELLIVIVVVAILAAVTIVAYNGIQARAKATQVESTVDQYRKALVQYATLNKEYPRVSGSFCLGEVADYPDGCFSGSDTDATVVTKLKSVLSTLPKVDSSCKMMYGNSCRRNLTFVYQPTATLDGSSHPYYLMYFLDGSQGCSIGGNVGGNWEAYTSAPNSSKYLERDSTTGVTMCVISMPDPAKM